MLNAVTLDPGWYTVRIAVLAGDDHHLHFLRLLGGSVDWSIAVCLIGGDYGLVSDGSLLGKGCRRHRVAHSLTCK